MGYFNRDDNRSGRDNRGGGRGFSRGDDRSREMFKTVCSNCGKDCEVPFRPSSGKPVYCSDCFEKMGGRNSDSGRSERPSFRPPAPSVDHNKAQFEELNIKLDKIISLLTPKVEEIKEVVVKKVTPKKKKV